jgi:cell wall-associated NlpC family hydrolase
MNSGRIAFVALLAATAGCAGAPSRPATTAAAPPPAAEPPAVVASGPPAASPLADTVVARARGLLGAPYRYGGADPASGFDCSGLVHYVFAQSGVRLPRTAESQQGAALRVEREALAPGDLVFFRLPEPHVGIYAGAGEFIHAPGRGRGVEVARLEDPWYVLAFAGAGRVPDSGQSPSGSATVR